MHVYFSTINPTGDEVPLYDVDLAVIPLVGGVVRLPELPHLRTGAKEWLTDWKVVAVTLELPDLDPNPDDPGYYDAYCEPAEYAGFTPACTCARSTPDSDDSTVCGNCGGNVFEPR